MPALLANKVLQYGIAALAVAALSIWLAGRVYYNPKLDDAAVKYADLKADYEAYKGAVAASVAKANADTLEEQKRLQHALMASYEDHTKTVKELDSLSSKLKGILTSAKPGDTRPIGPSVAEYIERLRESQGP